MDAKPRFSRITDLIELIIFMSSKLNGVSLEISEVAKADIPRDECVKISNKNNTDKERTLSNNTR